MTTPTPITPDDITTQIATLEQAVSGLLDPNDFAQCIADELNYLGNEGADPTSLDAIHANAAALTETANTLHQTMRASLNLARSVQQQRDSTRKALADLKEAIRMVDTDVPEIEELYNDVEQMVIEWQSMTWHEDMYEVLADEAFEYTGLEYTEINSLLNLLTGSGPSRYSNCWFELKDWINRTEIEAEEEGQSVED